MANGLLYKFQRFFRWWTGELKTLLPDAPRAGNARFARRRLVLSAGEDGNSIILEKGGQSELLLERSDDGFTELAGFANAMPNVAVGARFDSTRCFGRTLELPAQVESDFGRILELDMERTTPFRSGDVLTAYHALPDASPSPGMRAVRQLIIKRNTVEPILNRMLHAGIEPDFADCWDGGGQTGLPVNFLHSGSESGSQQHTRQISLIMGLSVFLLISAVAITIMRHEAALESLQSQISLAKGEAEKIRVAMASSERVSGQITVLNKLAGNRLQMSAILEELTARIPDSAWVSDLRIEADVVEFTGFARSAAGLVPVLEKSPMFNQVSFISPVIFDQQADRERFSMRLRLNRADLPYVRGADTPPPGAASL